MKILIYDCEIQACIPSKGQSMEMGLDYCGGWDDFENMGISCIGYAWIGSDPQILTNEEADQLADLAAEADVVCGFNSKSFDDRLVAACDINCQTDWDLLEAVRLAAYGSTRWDFCPSGHSYRLDFLAEKNLHIRKTGSGANAPLLWQRGEIEALHNYCKQDVEITQKLILRALNDEFIDPNTEQKLSLEMSALSPFT